MDGIDLTFDEQNIPQQQQPYRATPSSERRKRRKALYKYLTTRSSSAKVKGVGGED